MIRRTSVDSREEALRKMIQIGEEIRNSFENEEEYRAYEHWINNPLITPINKFAMFEDFESRTFEQGRSHERKLILNALRKEMDEQYDELEIIKKRISEQTNSLETSDLEHERVNTFMYISGIGSAIHIIEMMAKNEQA
jgi:hypothetical protein